MLCFSFSFFIMNEIKEIKMIWHYGIVFHKDKSRSFYGLHEIYEDEGTGEKSITDLAIIVADSKEELIDDLKMMIKDVEKGECVMEVDEKLELNEKDVKEINRRIEDCKNNPENLVPLDELNERIYKSIIRKYQERLSELELAISEHVIEKSGKNITTEHDIKLWDKIFPDKNSVLQKINKM